MFFYQEIVKLAGIGPEDNEVQAVYIEDVAGMGQAAQGVGDVASQGIGRGFIKAGSNGSVEIGQFN